MRTPSPYSDADALQFALWLCTVGIVSPGAAYHACEYRLIHKTKLGAIALANRELTIAQTMEILRRQTSTKQRFGEIAIELGYLTSESLETLLAIQNSTAPSIIEALSQTTDLDSSTLSAAYQRFLAVNELVEC